MKLIKLDAIDSTNDFLKGLSNTQELENYTVVTAENQTKGKGQMGAVWNSEKSKNLIMSVFVKDLLVSVDEIYQLNVATALAVIQVLKTFDIQNLSIKWPNDIMSANFKLAGILIENSFKSDGTITTIIGIGLNVNQTNFDNLPKASSMAVVANSTFDKDQLVVLIIERLKVNFELLASNSQILWDSYMELLFKKEVPMPFSIDNGKPFMAIIKGVSTNGKLILLLENDAIVEYGLKEIQMLY
ncbi:biotin--[acetyl-CoA-carboxylase] ligase [Flavobacterium sp. FBOR7N2.3]|uniref:Biotin--[acetyl-CoA-carboxylase] ligase n=1 Tax=Flavobacterium magnesitis TaxID=3138077 RepID=A0ABV4TMZ7_9FLAO